MYFEVVALGPDLQTALLNLATAVGKTLERGGRMRQKQTRSPLIGCSDNF